MRVFFVHVRYWGAFVIIFIGAVISIPGDVLITLGRWIGSRSDG